MGTNTTRLGLFQPDGDPTTGDYVDVDTDLNENFEKIDAAVGYLECTHATRPASPWSGQAIYETDTNLYFGYVEGAWLQIGVTALAMLQAAYPVGSLYMSTAATSPATLFGFGTWTAVAGRMLIGVDGTYTAGSTGGAATTTLTSTELPAHTHTGPSHTHGVNITSGTISADHSHNIGRDLDGAGSNTRWTVHTAGTSGAGGTSPTSGVSSNHTHNVNGTSDAAGTGATGSTGTGSAFSRLPPYLAVYIWTRTA
jgi:hypothetical protein